MASGPGAGRTSLATSQPGGLVRRQDEAVALQIALLEEAQRNHRNGRAAESQRVAATTARTASMTEGDRTPSELPSRGNGESRGFSGFGVPSRRVGTWGLAAVPRGYRPRNFTHESGFGPLQGFGSGFGAPSGFGSREFWGGQQSPNLPSRNEAAVDSAQPLPADDQSEAASPLRFSRACPVCFAENPRERAAYKCGHIICYKCAVKNARQPSSGGKCVFCRTPSGFVKLFEEKEAGDEPKPETAVNDEIRTLERRLAECQEEHDKLRKTNRDFSEGYDRLRQNLAQEYEGLQKQCREYDQRILKLTSEMELMKKRQVDCSCDGKPSVPVEEHEASMQLLQSRADDKFQSIMEHLLDCSCLCEPSVRAEEYQAVVEKYEDDIRSLEKELAKCSCSDDQPSVPLWKDEEFLKQHQAVMGTLSDMCKDYDSGTRGDEETLHQVQQDEEKE